MLPIFLVVFVDMIGIGIIIPVFAPMLLAADNNLLPGASFGARAVVLGFLLASYPLAQFFGAPIIGAFSDRTGRKKALMLSLTGTAIGYGLFALGIMAGSITLLFFSRILAGFMAGNIAVAMSAIADVSDQQSKAKNFGMVGMAFGFGFIIGPFIGGKLADASLVSWFTFATPFWFAMLLSLANIALIAAVLPETLRTRVSTPLSPLSGMRNVRRAFSFPGLRVLFVVMFLLTLGFSFFTQFFQVYVFEKFAFTQTQIADLFAYVGLWIAFSQGVLTRLVSRRLRPQQVLTVSLLLLGLSFPLLLIPTDATLLFVVLTLVPVFNGLTFPNATALVSNLAGRESQGEILGINQSIQALAIALPPMAAGFIAALDIRLPIVAASVLVLLSWLTFVAVFRSRNRHLFHEV